MALDSSCALDQYDKIRSTSVNDPELQAAAYEDHDAQEDEDCNDDASWTRQHGLTVAAGIVALAGLGIYFHNKQPVKKSNSSDDEKPAHDSRNDDALLLRALPRISESGGDELLPGEKPLLVTPPTSRSKSHPDDVAEGLETKKAASAEKPTEVKKDSQVIPQKGVTSDKLGAGSVASELQCDYVQNTTENKGTGANIQNSADAENKSTTTNQRPADNLEAKTRAWEQILDLTPAQSSQIVARALDRAAEVEQTSGLDKTRIVVKEYKMKAWNAHLLEEPEVFEREELFNCTKQLFQSCNNQTCFENQDFENCFKYLNDNLLKVTEIKRQNCLKLFESAIKNPYRDYYFTRAILGNDILMQYMIINGLDVNGINEQGHTVLAKMCMDLEKQSYTRSSGSRRSGGGERLLNDHAIVGLMHFNPDLFVSKVNAGEIILSCLAFAGVSQQYVRDYCLQELCLQEELLSTTSFPKPLCTIIADYCVISTKIRIATMKCAVQLKWDSPRHEQIDTIIKRNMNEQDEYGRTLLHYASSIKLWRDHFSEIIKKYEPNSWIKDKEGKYALDTFYYLDYNTETGSTALISDIMIKQRLAGTYTDDESKDNYLFYYALSACRSDGKSDQKNKDRVLSYLKFFKSDHKRYATSPQGESIFSYMLCNNIAEDVVQAMLDTKLDPNAQGEKGGTFMHDLAENVKIYEIKDFPTKMKTFLDLCKPNLLLQKRSEIQEEKLTVLESWKHALRAWERVLPEADGNWHGYDHHGTYILLEPYVTTLRSCVEIIRQIDTGQRSVSEEK